LTLCQYKVDCADILDARDQAERRAARVANADLECPDWRGEMLAGETPRSHRFAQRLVATGRSGLIVRSFASGAPANAFNLVFWRWGPDPPHQVLLVDPDRRLPRDQSSWR
jgi:RES domain-containing protein